MEATNITDAVTSRPWPLFCGRGKRGGWCTFVRSWQPFVTGDPSAWEIDPNTQSSFYMEHNNSFVTEQGAAMVIFIVQVEIKNWS